MLVELPRAYADALEDEHSGYRFNVVITHSNILFLVHPEFQRYSSASSFFEYVAVTLPTGSSFRISSWESR